MSAVRKLLSRGALSAAVIASGCSPRNSDSTSLPMPEGVTVSAPPQERADNLYTILGQYAFNDAKGNPINHAALKAQYQHKPVTLTFGFANCEEYCGPINQNLGQIGQRMPELTHVIISVDPNDNRNNATRERFLKAVRKSGVTNPVTILFPKHYPDVSSIANDANLIASSNPKNHTPYILYYEAGGNPITSVSGVEDIGTILSKLAPYLSHGQSK